MKRSTRSVFDRISRDWETLAADDPLWAVYVAPGTRGGGWDVAAFLETGRREIDRVMQALDALGLPEARRTALDFGCGVGRLSRPLAEGFERVVAIDVSATMIANARELHRDTDRIEFVLNQRADLAIVPSGSVDLVYSSLVLQHMSRSLAAGYLAEFMRVLAPGGVAVVQLATHPTASAKGWAARLLPTAAIGWLQTRFLGYAAPMRMEGMPERWVRQQVATAGGQVVDAAVDDSYGGHWTYTRYVLRRGGS